MKISFSSTINIETEIGVHAMCFWRLCEVPKLRLLRFVLMCLMKRRAVRTSRHSLIRARLLSTAQRTCDVLTAMRGRPSWPSSGPKQTLLKLRLKSSKKASPMSLMDMRRFPWLNWLKRDRKLLTRSRLMKNQPHLKLTSHPVMFDIISFFLQTMKTHVKHENLVLNENLCTTHLWKQVRGSSFWAGT